MNPGIKLEHRRLDSMSRLLVGDETSCSLAIKDNTLYVATNNDGEDSACLIINRAYDVQVAANTFLDITPFLFVSIGNKLVKVIDGATLRCEHVPGDFIRVIDSEKLREMFPLNSTGILKVDPSELPRGFDLYQLDSGLDEFFHWSRISEGPLKTDLYAGPKMKYHLAPLKRRVNVVIGFLISVLNYALDKKNDMKNPVDTIELLNMKKVLLAETLSWQASSWVAKKQKRTKINFRDPLPEANNEFYGAMNTFISRAGDHLMGFRLNLGSQRMNKLSLADFDLWRKDLERQILQGSIQIPEILVSSQKGIKKCLDKSLRHFFEIEKLTSYMLEHAKDEDSSLVKFLKQVNPTDLDASVHIIDEEDYKGLHGEIKIFAKFIENPPEYIGINQLCCPYCYFTLDKFNVKTRGCHGKIFSKWKISKRIIENSSYLEKFLGKSYELFMKLKEESLDGLALQIIPKYPWLKDEYLKKWNIDNPRRDHLQNYYAVISDNDI